MKTPKQLLTLFSVIMLSIFLGIEKVEADYTWNWDSGTTEGWIDGSGGTIVSVETGRNGTFGLGAQQPTPYVGAVFPIVKVEEQFIDPGPLVGGQLGVNLVMTGEIYMDINREMSATGPNYVDLIIWGRNTYGRFICYPGSGFGRVEDIGDGWFRHYFGNRGHEEYSGVEPGQLEKIGSIYLDWNWNYNATYDPVVFDNLTIIPEPCTLALLGLGALVLRRRR